MSCPMVAGVRVESNGVELNPNGVGDGARGWGFMSSSQLFSPMSGFCRQLLSLGEMPNLSRV